MSDKNPLPLLGEPSKAPSRSGDGYTAGVTPPHIKDHGNGYVEVDNPNFPNPSGTKAKPNPNFDPTSPFQYKDGTK